MTRPITHEQLRSDIRSGSPPLIIDVRRQAAFLEATDLVQGALRRDPETVATWVDHLPRTARVVVYCAHGHEISQGLCAALRALGADARHLVGGIEAWRRAGMPLQALAQ